MHGAAARAEPPPLAPLQLYADIVANVHIGLVVWRLEHFDDPRTFRLVAANPAAGAIVRRPLAKLVGKTMPECIPALFKTDRPGIYAEVVRSGQPTNVDNVVYSNPRVTNSVFAIWSNATMKRATSSSSFACSDILNRRFTRPL